MAKKHILLLQVMLIWFPAPKFQLTTLDNASSSGPTPSSGIHRYCTHRFICISTGKTFVNIKTNKQKNPITTNKSPSNLLGTMRCSHYSLHRCSKGKCYKKRVHPGVHSGDAFHCVIVGAVQSSCSQCICQQESEQTGIGASVTHLLQTRFPKDSTIFKNNITSLGTSFQTCNYGSHFVFKPQYDINSRIKCETAWPRNSDLIYLKLHMPRLLQ